MSDKAAGQKARSPEGCDENGLAAALLLSHVSIQICSFLEPVRLGPPCRRPILSATPLHQSLTCALGESTFLGFKLQGLDDYQLFVGNFGQAHLIKAQVRLDHLRRESPQPLVEGDVLENIRGEHLQEYCVGVAGVLDIVRGV